MNNTNLKPFTGATDPRRQNGRPKGVKNLRTIVKELEREDFDWSILPSSGTQLDAYYRTLGSPWKVIVMRALIDAVNGNSGAREWLRKACYGNKVEIFSSERTTERPVIISEIKPHYK